MDNAIIGVRYIGKKDSQSDTVCKTGAVWSPGQVHNFASGLAQRMFLHTDSFEPAEIDMSGQTFMSAGKSQARESASYISLSAMTPDQLVHLARFEFNRVINPAGKSVDQLRQEVQSLMVSHSLDVLADEQSAGSDTDYRVPVIYQATPEEHAAIKSGDLRLVLMPAVLHESLISAQAAVSTEPAEGPADPGDIVLTLDKDGLAAYALEHFDAKLDKRKSLDDLRAQVLELVHAEDAQK